MRRREKNLKSFSPGKKRGGGGERRGKREGQAWGGGILWQGERGQTWSIASYKVGGKDDAIVDLLSAVARDAFRGMFTRWGRWHN